MCSTIRYLYLAVDIEKHNVYKFKLS